MKKVYTFCFLAGSIFCGEPALAILNYSMAVSTPGFTPLTGATSITNFNWGCGGDGMMSSALPMGFTFVYDGHNYTQFQVTENGRLILGNSVTPCDNGCGVGCDVTGPNYQLQQSSGAGGGLAASQIHPTICPLWDDLGFNNSGGKGSYLSAGSGTNHTLTVEWLLMYWKFSNTNAPTTTGTISFQVILYETPAGQIDFIYRQESQALGAVPAQHARIGLTGFSAGDFYATTSAGATPSKSTESDVNTKPTNGARFRWTASTPTPIELIYFRGESRENKNVLEWSTATEKDNDYFTIDRSADAIAFETLANVAGAGNSDVPRLYSYADTPIPEGLQVCYYRLKQTDRNGKYVYSDVIPVSMPLLKDDPPEIYYTASSGLLNIRTKLEMEGNVRIDITDAVGKIFFQQEACIETKGKNVVQILLPSLLPGLYYARVSARNVLLQSKFINY
jgi:hypothetical protein